MDACSVLFFVTLFAAYVLCKRFSACEITIADLDKIRAIF